MDMENEKINNHQEVKGTETPKNHLSGSYNSMEMKAQVSSDSSKVDEVSDTSKVIVLANRYGKTPASDNSIMRNILSRLRAKHLIRFKAVCTQWKSMIETDSNLIDLQYRRHRVGNKPLLYAISPLPPKPDEPERVRGTIDFAGNRPIEVQRLELERSNFGIPKQTVAGLKKGVVRALNVYFPSRPGCTEEDRVFCLQKHEDGEENPLFDHPDGFEEVGADEEQVCEVFTVGENTWRRIDAVPPYSLLSKVCYLGDLDQYNEESKSVYVKGCPFSLWILDQDDGSNKWSYEKLRIPCNWNGLRDLSIEAVPGPSGTKCIILKLQTSEDIYFYDRDRSGIFGIQTFDEMHGHEGLNYQPGELREILALVDSLTPVCTKPCSMF
ncbi:hypothetical protein MKW92_013627 [Papaver armeniacum]|nr:hypothetical protein MKW92_013627 [Papaver armeniacum]